MPKPKLLLFVVFAVFLMAARSIPMPPADNPHPATTPEDIKRVQFAEAILKNYLMSPGNLAAPSSETKANYDILTTDEARSFEITEDCFKNTTCVAKNENFISYIASQKAKMGWITEFKHMHIVPWSMERFLISTPAPNVTATTNKPKMAGDQGPSIMPDQRLNLKPDEYLLHAYVSFENSSYWYHFELIVSEDENHHITLRRFFIFPMPQNNQSLPPGTVC